MSDDEKLNLRDLPPVPPIEWYKGGRRMSQTLASRVNVCMRSAYLYAKHNGGAGSHQLDRGTLVHEFWARMLVELVRRREPSLYVAAVDEDPVHAENAVASLTSAMVDEILRERPDLQPTLAEIDAARAMCFHLAVANDIDPETIIGIERKFVLELDCGVVVSGRVDVATSSEPGWAEVHDAKTTFNVATEEDFDDFQVKLYLTLVALGRPVEKGPNGEEVLLEPLGGSFNRFRGREVYPRPRPYEHPDGRRTLKERGFEQVYTRTELHDFKNDLELLALRLLHGIETGKFPAIPGSHCSTCTSTPECPLPSHLRRYAGTILTPAQAAEAWAWAQTQKIRVAATEKEVKNFVKGEGPFVLGDDAIGFTIVEKGMRFKQRKGKSLLPDLVEAAEARAKYGSEFKLEDYVLTGGVENRFGPVDMPPDEVAEIRRQQYGDDDAGDGDVGLDGDGERARGEGADGADGAAGGGPGDDAGPGDQPPGV